MILPKVTRQRIRAAGSEAVEIPIPNGEACKKWQSYGVQAGKGRPRLFTIFVEAIERHGEISTARVRVTDQPRFMAAQNGMQHPPQYASNAAQSIDPDAEAVDPATQRRISQEAEDNRDHMQVVNQARRETYELEQRLKRAREEADARGVDISSPVRVIERQVAVIEQRAFEGKAA